jgi:SAM-dependent methyltransferase
MRKSLLLLSAGTALVGAALVAARFFIFLAPLAWTGEAARLVAELELVPGETAADVGAGSGAMAVAVAARLGPEGRVFATELTAGQRDGIAARAEREGARTITVVAATPTETGLPDGCCDALYLRTVFHHVEDRAAFASALTRAARPGARIAVIDFAPGALWFHGADHGVSAEAVRDAFRAANWRLRTRIDGWGGGLFLLVFEAGSAADARAARARSVAGAQARGQ